MPTSTVRVRGLKELQRDFRNMDKESAKDLRKDLKEVGEIVRKPARDDLARLSTRSAGGLRTVVRQRGVSVEQRYGRTTGARPDWGQRQIRLLGETLDDKENDVVKQFETTLDKLADRHGF